MPDHPWNIDNVRGTTDLIGGSVDDVQSCPYAYRSSAFVGSSLRHCVVSSGHTHSRMAVEFERIMYALAILKALGSA